MAKGRKAKKAKKPAKKTKKAVKRAEASASRGRTKKRKPAKAARRKTAKARRPAVKKAAPKKKQIVGEGDYQASRNFLKDQSDFVHRHSGEIPKMGKDAEAALEGPQGGELRAAEEEALGHSKSPEE